MAAEQESDATTSLSSFRAELDVFSGPLDLLLHLIKQEEVDIFEVRVSEITDRYLAAIRTMEFFDVNVAADFLVMAATLMEIKSRTLLPPSEADEEDEEDPGVELVRRLLQYKQFKEAAEDLEDRAQRRTERFARPRPPEPEVEQPGPDALLEDLEVWDLMAAFAEVVEQTQLKPSPRVIRSDVPVSVYVGEVVQRLRRAGGELGFLDLFREENTRERVVGIFLALLELVRRRRIRLDQPDSSARSIRIGLLDEDPDEEPNV